MRGVKEDFDWQNAMIELTADRDRLAKENKRLNDAFACMEEAKDEFVTEADRWRRMAGRLACKLREAIGKLFEFYVCWSDGQPGCFCSDENPKRSMRAMQEAIDAFERIKNVKRSDINTL